MIRLLLAAGLALAAQTVLAQGSPTARFLGAMTWRESGPDFGGFSGLEVGPDGRRFWIVTDAGNLSSGRFRREGPDETIAGVEAFSGTMLVLPNGKPVYGYLNDAEGLAMNAEGTLFVSFEGEHRIWSYPGIDRIGWTGQRPVEIPDHPAFAELQNNSSLEALAVAPDGTVITIPERSGVLTRPFPAFRYRDGAWLADASIRRVPPYLVTGGDFGPDGRFYLLERHLQGVFGFRTRVRRFDYGPDGFSGEVTVLETGSARHDNLEGLSVWRDGQGRIRLTMVSDDNFRSFQRTELVEYVIEE